MGELSKLSALAADINAEHRACETAARSAVEHAVKAGELLTKAKGLCRHGTWRDWVQDNCEFSERTAQVYMRVNRELPKAQRVADLSLRETVKLLAKPAGDRLEYIDVSSVVVVDHPRTDLGDIPRLAKSIDAIGLLHPILVDSRFVLIVGLRRLEAYKHLGWSQILAKVFGRVWTDHERLEASLAENTWLDYSPSECVRMGRALEAELEHCTA